MSRYRLATVGIGSLLCCIAAFAANAERACARGAGDFCLVAAANTPSAREARPNGWTEARTGAWGQWASGSRMRFGGTPTTERNPIQQQDEPDVNVPQVGRISLDAASLGARRLPRTGYGAALQPLEPTETGIHGSYPLSESFSLDVTAGKGRVGLRAALPDPGHVSGTGFGLAAGPVYDRTAWSVALNASRQFGAFGIGGRIGYVDVRDQPETYFDALGSSSRLGAERSMNLRRSFLGIDASYDVTRNWQLHGGAIYRRDEGRPAASFMGFGTPLAADRDEKEWGVGVRYYGWRNFRLNVEYLKSSGRDQFGNESLLFMGRFDF